MNQAGNKYFILLLLFLILTFILIQKNKESFALSMGRYIRFMKEDKFSDNLSEGDLKLMNDIQDCYKNKNLYYKCINSLGIPYLREPKKNKSFSKNINYRKHKHVSHLLPYKPHFR